MGDPAARSYDMPVFKVLLRCTNLQALYWEGNGVNSDFGRYLASICTRLEHLYLRDVNTFEKMAGTYTRCVPKVTATCLHLGEDDDEITDDIERNLMDFVCNGPQLDAYFNFSTLNTTNVNKKLVPQLKELKV